MATIEIPDFEFSGFYYPEILADLIDFFRKNMPEISDEDPTEPAIQLARAFALSAHLNNVYLDIVAKERFLPTAQLRESIRAHLALIGVQLAQASPATAGVFLELTQPLTTQTTVAPAGSKVSSRSTADRAPIVYETTDDVVVDRTDVLGWLRVYDSSRFMYYYYTNPNQHNNLWSAYYVGANDCLYVGHSSAMWNKIKIVVDNAAAAALTGVWEFYDGDYNDTTPDNVTTDSDNIVFELNDWLGSSSRAGMVVRIKCRTTGIYQDGRSVYYEGGVNKVATNPSGVPPANGLLGQSVASTDPDDYVIGSLWQELPNVTDGTQNFSVSGTKYVSFDLPQNTTQRWVPCSVGGVGYEATGYWVRYRIISTGGNGYGPHTTSWDISTGKTYAYVSVVQGEAQNDNPLGSSNGQTNQIFELNQYPVIDDENIGFFVTEGSTEYEWTRVDNFLNSLATDRHFVVRFDDDGKGYISTGDGINGRIPPAGSNNCRASYRSMDDVDGNLGPNEIVSNTAGLAYVARLFNARTAIGYTTAEGSTPEDIERLKVAGPASLQVLSRGVTINDIQTLAEEFVAADGTKPFSRTLCIEEGYGPKTVKLVVVGTGGMAVEQDRLDEIQTYFNGDPTQDVEGALLLNTQLTAANYTPRTIDVYASVYGGNLSTIQNVLSALLTPNAIKNDGTYQWDFAGEVPVSVLTAAIMGSSSDVRKVHVSYPGSDVVLGAEELPVKGTFNITVYA
jgi:hypothetical protein